MTARIMVTVSPNSQLALRNEADRLGIPMSTVVCIAIADYLEQRERVRPRGTKPAEPSKSATVMEKPSPYTSTDITQAEREKRLWDLRTDETRSALQRGWPFPVYDDHGHGHAWWRTGENLWDGEWVTEDEYERREAEGQRPYEEETTS